MGSVILPTLGRGFPGAPSNQYSAEEKIKIVLGGIKDEDNIAELCRREGMAHSQYYSSSKKILEAGKKRLTGDTASFHECLDCQLA